MAPASPPPLPYTLRDGQPSDRSFVLGLVPRFIEQNCPPGYAEMQVLAGIERPLLRFFEDLLTGAALDPEPTERLLIAQTPQGLGLGYIYLKLQVDPFSGDRQGHISHLAVTEAAEGQGVAKALMQAGQAWFLQQGCRSVMLFAFADNQRARAFYEAFGFEVEMVKYVWHRPVR